MPPFIYFLDILGTFAFAVLGAEAALKRRFDIFGIVAAGFLTALAGGTIREILLGNLPLYFRDNVYVLAVFAGIIFALALYQVFPKVRGFILGVDALGIGTFAVIGASRADAAGLGFFGITLLATLTAVGGGIVRDVVLRHTPRIFYEDFYATPAIIAGMTYAIFRSYMQPWAVYILIALVFGLRLIGMQYNLRLWRPFGKEKDQKVRES